MAPKYRQLHTKIVDSYDFSEMPDDFCRMFWMLLMVIVDREGRGMDNAAWIRSKMFPLREDVDLEPINNAMDWLGSDDRGMIRRYVAAGRRYFDIPTFHNYQSGWEREAVSTIPPYEQGVPTYSRPTPDLLASNSGVTPSQPTNTMQSTNTHADARADADGGAPDAYDDMRDMVEKIVGYPPTPRDMPFLQEFVKRGVTQADLANALGFLQSVNKTPRGAADLAGSVYTAIAKRTQARNKSPGVGVTFTEYFAQEAAKEATNGNRGSSP